MTFKQISQESHDLLLAMDGVSLASPEGQIEVSGKQIIRGGTVIGVLESDEDIQALWQEYCFQHDGGSR